MLKYGQVVELKLNSLLCTAGEPILQAYFPTDGFISQIVSTQNTDTLATNLVGCEGMLGATLLLGEKNAPITAVVHRAGTALSMTSSQLCRALCQNPALLQSLNRYLFATLRDWAQAALCAHFHQREERLSKWLLMADDRTHQSAFYITQDTLAKLLGIQRNSVTVAANGLRKKHLIQYDGDNINITNRLGLESVACQCYSGINKTVKRVTPC